MHLRLVLDVGTNLQIKVNLELNRNSNMKVPIHQVSKENQPEEPQTTTEAVKHKESILKRKTA